MCIKQIPFYMAVTIIPDGSSEPVLLNQGTSPAYAETILFLWLL